MSYSAYEYSAQSGDPKFRFLFVQGALEYRKTTETMIVSDSNGTWTPSSIKMSDVNITNEMAKDPIKLSLPRDDDFAQLFLTGVPEQITSVTVFRGHASDTDEEFQFYWKGRVAGVSVSGDTVTIECENIFTSMRRPGLRARYQKGCRHALYQRGCNLHDYDFAVAATATSVAGNILTIPEAEISSALEAGYFNGGMLETSDGSLRFITSHDDTQITLMSPIASLTDEINGSDGQASVIIYPGCDHTLDTCINKFNNRDNYGGFPWLPSKNPFANNVSGSIA